MMITDRPDPMVELPITDAHMRWALEAVEEVSGEKGMVVILRQAGLERCSEPGHPRFLWPRGG